MSNEFPINIDEALKMSAGKHNLRQRHNTHYDANDRELYWFEKNIRKRINYTFVKDSITVVFYIDTYPFYPKMWIWCHRNIPMFPYGAKIKWERIESLPSNETVSFYLEKIESHILHLQKQSGRVG